MNAAGLQVWARGHGKELAAAGAGGVALYALYAKHRAAAAPVDPNADPTGVLSAATNPVDPTAFSSAPYDAYDSIQQQLQLLQQQLNQAPDPVAPVPTPTGGGSGRPSIANVLGAWPNIQAGYPKSHVPVAPAPKPAGTWGWPGHGTNL